MSTMQPMATPDDGLRITMRVRQVIGTVLALTLLLAGCGGSSEESGGGGDAGGPPAEPVPIRIGYFLAAQEILYVMQQLPEVAPNQGTWYEVEWSEKGDPSAIPRDLAAGVLDAGAITPLSMARALEQGADFVVTGEFIEDRKGWGGLTWLVRKDAGVGSAVDLRGQTIGTPSTGGHADYLQDTWLGREAGLKPDQDYQTTQIPFPQMADALAAGHIAAGPLPPPFLQQAMATGQYRPLFSITDVQPRLVAILLGFTREFATENPVTVEKFMEDWVTVAQWIADPANRQRVLEANSKTTELPVDVLDRYLLTRDDGYRPPNGAVDQEALQQTWDFFHEAGAFSQPVEVSDHVIDDLLPPPA